MARGKRGQLLPGVSLAAWAASSSSSLGVAGAVAALSPLLSHHGWAAAGVTGLRKSGAPRKAAQLSLPPPPSPCPCKAREGLRDFSPLPPPFGRQEGQSKAEMEAGKLLVVVDGELMAILGSKGFLRSLCCCLLAARTKHQRAKSEWTSLVLGSILPQAIPWPYPHAAQPGTAGVPQSLMN